MKPAASLRTALLSTLVLATAALQGGEDGPATAPPRTIQDITRLLDGVAPDPSAANLLRARMDQPVPAALDRSAQAKAYWDRARAAQEAGAVQHQIADLKRALELGGAGDSDRIRSELASAQWQGGNTLDALHGFEAFRHMGRPGFEASHAAILARVQVALGDLPAAHKLLDSARSSLARAQWLRNAPVILPNWRANVGFAQGEILDAEGRLPEAETAFRKALADNDTIREYQRTFQEIRYDFPAAETMATRGDAIQSSLAMNLMRQGRLEEAELAVRELLQRSLAQHGRQSMNTGMVVTTFSRILYEGGRFQEAEHMAREAILILDRAGVVAQAHTLLRARWMRAEALVSLGRDLDACAEYQQARSGLQASGQTPLLVREEAPWALALIRTGQPEAALRLLAPMIQASRAQLGDDHGQTVEWRGFEAMARARLGQRAEALKAFGQVSATLLRRRPDGDPDRDTPGAVQRRGWILEAYVDLLARIHEAGQDEASGLDVPAEALRLADQARSGRVQSAVTASATRAAFKDPRMAQRVRRQQDLKLQAAALYQLLGDALSAPVDQQSAAAVQGLRRTLATLDHERKTLDADLLDRFPGYKSLVDPAPATLAETRAALADDEAFLSILVTGERSYLWAFKRQGPVAFTASALGEREIAPMVLRLRQAVDPGQSSGPLPAFDLAVAYRLYQELLAPVEPVWHGAGTLAVCVNGSLAQLPLSVLPTRPWTLTPAPTRFAEYRDVPWLARTCAVYQVPSVASFVRLRGLGPGRPGRRAFLGFGDPQFSRVPAPPPAPPNPGLELRNLAIIPGPKAGAAPAAPDDWADYGSIPPLPETRGEILAIAALLGADPARDVFLGKAASKKTLSSLPLDQWRVLAFATHGLVPGEFPGLREPALALAAPDNPAETGLLTLDEILALKLDADWVVLSACNTAAGDGLGAEAVSGLGRAFFYAGSRALLVTHWPVETRSARDLVTSVFRHQAAAGAVSRAEALRQAMLEVMSGQCLDPDSGKPLFSYAHPLFWAPYALVGDGGRSAGP